MSYPNQDKTTHEVEHQKLANLNCQYCDKELEQAVTDALTGRANRDNLFNADNRNPQANTITVEQIQNL